MAAGRLVSRIEDYISRADQFASAKTPNIVLPKGEIIADALTKVRVKIGDLRGEIYEALAAPYPAEDAKKIVREHVDRLARLGAVDVSPTVEMGGLPLFPQIDHSAPLLRESPDSRYRNAPLIDGAAVLPWLHRDELILRLEAEIDRISDDESALSERQRREIVDKAKGAILEAERREEALIELGEAQGMKLARLEGADPRAVIGVDGPEPRED